jgi:hypothetical protein
MFAAVVPREPEAGLRKPEAGSKNGEPKLPK